MKAGKSPSHFSPNLRPPNRYSEKMYISEAGVSSLLMLSIICLLRNFYLFIKFLLNDTNNLFLKAKAGTT